MRRPANTMATELLEKDALLDPSVGEHLARCARTGAVWLTDARAEGLASHLAYGVPTTRHEEWKYTSLRGLVEAGPWALAPEAGPDADAVLAWEVPGVDTYRIVFVNGRHAPSLSSSGSIEGLEIGVLSASDDARLAELVDHATDVRRHGFAGLNSALFMDGALIRLARGCRPDRPVHVLHVSTGGGVRFPRVLVVCEPESDATLIETYASLDATPGFTDAVTEIYVAPNAHLEHIKVQRENEASFHIALTGVRQEHDSAYNGYSVTFGGALTRNDLNVFLGGSNIHSRMDGVYALTGDQLCDNHTRLDHAFPHCDSFEVYKGVLDDRSTGVFNGKIFVHEDAQKTDAKQTNQAILLSRHATVNTKPQLEIFADDVKCTHGATIGQLREEALFYLQSRGISKNDAEALLVYAFASEVLEKITVPALRASLEAALYEKLGARAPAV